MMAEPTYRLPCSRRFGYGVGHVLNDLCASIWFSYLLVFYHSVLGFSNKNAGYLMLLGQVADAISTPLVGYESDKAEGFCRYTKRKSWHLLGTICVMSTFPFLFMVCLGCSNPAPWAQFFYYVPFVVIFQFGWASTQISHLSLIPELTVNANERVELNALRYAFTVSSNIAVYVMTWLLLNDTDNSSLGLKDAPKFRILVLTVVGVGAFFSFLFHILTEERQGADHPRGFLSRLGRHSKMQWSDWLKETQFYLIALLYMSTRLIVNVSQIYMPMYLTDSLLLPKQFIATVPLAVFISGFLVSFIMRPINGLAGRKVTYFIGICLILGACVWMFFIRKQSQLEVFGPGILLGAGGSTILVTSLSMTADLIGDRTESGAFVYGAMSFTDKLSNGIAVVIIQHMHPCKTSACCPACVWYYRDMMVFVVGGVAIFAIICIIMLAPQKIGKLRKCLEYYGVPEESQALLPEKQERETSPDDCCSYLCCVRASHEAQVHKVVLCDACGQLTCGPQCVSPQSNIYESIDSLVRAAQQEQRAQIPGEGSSSTRPVSSNGKVLSEEELKNCLDCSPIKDASGNLAESSVRNRVKVDVDVHS